MFFPKNTVLTFGFKRECHEIDIPDAALFKQIEYCHNQNSTKEAFLPNNFRITMGNTVKLSADEQQSLLSILLTRFRKNMHRHMGVDWVSVEAKLVAHPGKLWSLYKMEETGGEPDVVGEDAGVFLFFDCSEESPKGRRSICFDRAAWEARKENKPENTAEDMAKEMGIELLTEEQYRYLQTLGKFDQKTSSWIQTPERIRKLKGALFCDRRYDTVFTYHNGADSYYAARGFRGVLKV